MTAGFATHSNFSQCFHKASDSSAAKRIANKRKILMFISLSVIVPSILITQKYFPIFMQDFH